MSTSNWIYGCVASSGPIRSGGFQQLVITGVAGVDGSFAREILFFCASRRGRSRGQSILINTPHFYCTTYARLVRQRQLGPSFWRWNQTSKNFFLRENKITERVNFCLDSRLLVFIAPPMGVFWGRRQLGSPILVEADYHLKVFEPTLIWTGCSPDGEIPLYSWMRLNYPSCDRLLLTNGAP